MPNVKYAVYGAFGGPTSQDPVGFDVREKLQAAIDSQGGIVTIDNNTFGFDPLPNAVKHFGALVTVGNQDVPYACKEGQKIDFNFHAGLDQETTKLQVLFAVYGAIPDTNIGFEESQAIDVTSTLQALLSGDGRGFVEINNSSFGGDPAPNEMKHFAAAIRFEDGAVRYFACQEGQSTDFNDE